MRFCYLFAIIIILNSCKAISYFKTPNDVFKTSGTVHMLDGTERKGDITIQFENGYDSYKYIRLSNAGKDDKILLDSIKAYSVKDDFYYPKIIDLDFNGSQKLLFVKRLSKENSRIHFYELFLQKKQNSDGADQYLYFISLPAQDRLDAYNVGGKELVPDFDKKMSLIVQDCPSLAAKIRTKAKGYFLPQLTLSNQKKVAIFMSIIDEYNICK